MFNSIDYLTKKATFKQVNPDFPITQTIPDSEDPKVFNGAIQLTDSALIQANDYVYISHLIHEPLRIETLFNMLRKKARTS